MLRRIPILALAGFIMLPGAHASPISEAQCQAQRDIAQVGMQNALHSGQQNQIRAAQALVDNAERQCALSEQIERNSKKLQDAILKTQGGSSTSDDDDN